MSILYKDDITGKVNDTDADSFEITIEVRNVNNKVINAEIYSHVEQAVADVFMGRILTLVADLKKAVK